MGGYLLGGTTGGQYHILKLTSIGILSWERVCGGSDLEMLYGVVEHPEGNYVIVGYSQSVYIPGAANNGGSDGLVLFLNGI